MKKNIFIAALVFLFILSFSGAVFARDLLYILKFEKGEMFCDFDQAKASSTLTKKNTRDGNIGAKVKISEKGYYVGEWGPQRDNWDGYSNLTFYVFNEEKEERRIILRVKGTKNPSGTPENTLEVTLKLPTGGSTQTINIADTLCLDGKSKLDLTKIAGYSFVNIDEGPLTIDISEFKLLK